MATVARNARLLQKGRFAPEMGWPRWLARHAWVFPVLAAGLWLRVVGLRGHFLYGDEAEYAIVARYISRDWTFLAYPALDGMGAQPFVSQPPLLLYLMAISMRLFGANDVAALLPSVLLGTGTILAVYALGLRLGGRTVGLSAAAVLAFLPFHIDMSRKAMLDAGYVFFLVLTAYFLVRWIETRSRGHALAVGAAAAAASLSKLPGVLACGVALAVFGAVLAGTIARKERGRVTETLLQGGMAAGVVAAFAVAYLALLAWLAAIANLWTKLGWQLGRVDSSYADIVDQAQVRREWDWYFANHQFGFYAKIGAAFTLLALAGAAVALWRLARNRADGARHMVVPVFVAVLAAFFLYSERKEGFYLLPFAPFFALLVGYAADAVRRGAARVAPKKLAAGAVAAAMLLVAVPLVPAASESYDEYALGNTQEKYFGSGTREAALFIQSQDPAAGQYGTLLGRFTLFWYNEQPTSHWYIEHGLIEHRIAEGDLKFVVYDEYLDLAFDREFMRQLINEHNGQLVAEYESGWGDVKVFELQAGG